MLFWRFIFHLWLKFLLILEWWDKGSIIWISFRPFLTLCSPLPAGLWTVKRLETCSSLINSPQLQNNPKTKQCLEKAFFFTSLRWCHPCLFGFFGWIHKNQPSTQFQINVTCMKGYRSGKGNLYCTLCMVFACMDKHRQNWMGHFDPFSFIQSNWKDTFAGENVVRDTELCPTGKKSSSLLHPTRPWDVILKYKKHSGIAGAT